MHTAVPDNYKLRKFKKKKKKEERNQANQIWLLLSSSGKQVFVVAIGKIDVNQIYLTCRIS